MPPKAVCPANNKGPSAGPAAARKPAGAAAPSALSGADLNDTYRTANDDANSKKADIAAVRSELEDFEARLEHGGGGGGAPHSHQQQHHHVPSPAKRGSGQGVGQGGVGIGGPKPTSPSGGGGGRPASVAMTEEEREAQRRRQSDISDVRNLPSDSDDDD